MIKSRVYNLKIPALKILTNYRKKNRNFRMEKSGRPQ